MLRVDSSEPLLTYDIHAIISSFYPGEEIKVVTPESHVHDRVLKGLTPVMRVFVDSGRTEKCGEGSGNIAVEIDPCRPEGESDVTGSHVSFTESGNVYGGGPVWHPGESKDDIKRFIYTCLSKERGMILPWGVLTGVRPVKPALSMLEKGAFEREVKEKYISDYYVNQDKADLVYEIAERESKILSGLM
nr:hypothetical protein [Lachnospiraceae bacterium]